MKTNASNINNHGERTYESPLVFHRGHLWQQSSPVRAQFVKIIWRKKNETQKPRVGILVCFILTDKLGLHTLSLDGTSVDLTVVPPACPHRAAALLLGGVPGQDVITEVCIVQVVVALFPLLW